MRPKNGLLRCREFEMKGISKAYVMNYSVRKILLDESCIGAVSRFWKCEKTVHPVTNADRCSALCLKSPMKSGLSTSTKQWNFFIYLFIYLFIKKTADIWREIDYPMLILWEIMMERHNWAPLVISGESFSHNFSGFATRLTAPIDSVRDSQYIDWAITISSVCLSVTNNTSVLWKWRIESLKTWWTAASRSSNMFVMCWCVFEVERCFVFFAKLCVSVT